MSDKIKPHHLERKAILYIRQSSAYQVSHNLESQKLQYAMQERLQQLGWREIEVVDDDLGRSAAGTVTRAGFERIVAEVCLGKVGAVAAREVSRFARNRREWQQLVEVCRIVDTLLVDQETVYSPRQSNDRLLLGLKGSLNEYELDLLRQRTLRPPTSATRNNRLPPRSPAITQQPPLSVYIQVKGVGLGCSISDPSGNALARRVTDICRGDLGQFHCRTIADTAPCSSKLASRAASCILPLTPNA